MVLDRDRSDPMIPIHGKYLLLDWPVQFYLDHAIIKNRLRFDKVTKSLKVGTFLRHSVCNCRKPESCRHPCDDRKICKSLQQNRIRSQSMDLFADLLSQICICIRRSPYASHCPATVWRPNLLLLKLSRLHSLFSYDAFFVPQFSVDFLQMLFFPLNCHWSCTHSGDGIYRQVALGKCKLLNSERLSLQ